MLGYPLQNDINLPINAFKIQSLLPNNNLYKNKNIFI